MGQALGRIDVEQPNFDVVATREGYEVRHYTDSLVRAEVSSSDWPESPTGDAKFGNQAFRVLASYIGVFRDAENESAGKSTPIAMTAPVVSQKAAPEKVAMTAPVVSSGGGEAETMAFILPAKYTMETAPRPTDPRVKLVSHPPQTVAVHTFSWWCDTPRAESEAAAFLARLEADKVKVVGSWSLARYNPPWTLPWLRTNEIHVPIEHTAE